MTRSWPGLQELPGEVSEVLRGDAVEAQFVAGDVGHQGFACCVQDRQRGLADDAPASGGDCGRDHGLASGHGYGTGGNGQPRVLEPGTGTGKSGPSIMGEPAGAPRQRMT